MWENQDGRIICKSIKIWVRNELTSQACETRIETRNGHPEQLPYVQENKKNIVSQRVMQIPSYILCIKQTKK